MRSTNSVFQTLCGCCVMLLISATSVLAGDGKSGTAPMKVSNGKQVALVYTMKLDDQSVVDSNVGGEPLTVTQGSHQIIPGVEKEIEGMAVGEKKRFSVVPTEGYGNVDSKAFQEVDKEMVPPDARMVGMELEGKTADGRTVFPRISEVKNETIVLDFNHPLAGKTLHFDVQILDVAPIPSTR